MYTKYLGVDLSNLNGRLPANWFPLKDLMNTTFSLNSVLTHDVRCCIQEGNGN